MYVFEYMVLQIKESYVLLLTELVVEPIIAFLSLFPFFFFFHFKDNDIFPEPSTPTCNMGFLPYLGITNW